MSPSRSSTAFIPVRVSVVLLLIAFRVAVPPSGAWAVTYYVDGNNPQARDSNTGTEAQPWKTISKSTGLLQPGDTLLVKAGTSRETVILSKSGTAAQPITIQAHPGHEGKAIINAAEPLTTWRQCTGPNATPIPRNFPPTCLYNKARVQSCAVDQTGRSVRPDPPVVEEDGESFRPLVERYAGSVTEMIRNIGGYHQACEGLVQEVFLTAAEMTLHCPREEQAWHVLYYLRSR